MPIFEYQCRKCDTVFEKLVTGQAQKNYKCPKCESMETDKILSRFSGIVSSNSSYCPAKSICEPAGHKCGGCCPMHNH